MRIFVITLMDYRSFWNALSPNIYSFCSAAWEIMYNILSLFHLPCKDIPKATGFTGRKVVHEHSPSRSQSHHVQCHPSILCPSHRIQELNTRAKEKNVQYVRQHLFLIVMV